VSPSTAASIAAWIVGYSLGTSRSIAEEIEAKISNATAKDRLVSRLGICASSFN
jgi:hypothetical protein